MSSGYFPLNKYDNHYDDLSKILNSLDEVLSNYGDWCASLSVSEDAVRDGMFLSDLHRARDLIASAIR